MHIRTYQPGDEKSIIALEDTVLKEYGFRFLPKLDRDLLDIPKYYTNRMGQFFVLVDGDKVVGSIGVSKITARVCKLRRFYILKHYRKQGWGRKLYQEALEFIRGVGYGEIWLSSAPQFKDALRFYEYAGFKRTEKTLWPHVRAGIFYVMKLE